MSNIKFVCLDGATEIFKVDSNGFVTSTLDITTTGRIESTTTTGSTILSNVVSILNTDLSTNSSTGALVVEGGLSINANSNAISETRGNALTVRGGVGISEDCYIGGDTYVSGNLVVSGTQTVVSSESLVINDNLLLINSGPPVARDSGLIASRFQTENNAALGEVITDVPFFTDTLPTQTGVTSTTLILSGSASAVDDDYNGMYILITSGVGINQVRLIKDYVGSTKTVTVNLAWNTQPGVGAGVSLFNKPSVVFYYDQDLTKFRLGYTTSDSSSANIILTEDAPLEVGNVTIDGTNPESFLVRKDGDTGDLFRVDTTNDRVLIGSGNPVTDSAQLHLYGTSGSSNGPHWMATTTADTYPVFQQLNWTHDNISLAFDAYHDGTDWRSADFGSNFQIYKFSDLLRFTYASGVSAGSVINPNPVNNIGFSMSNTGLVQFEQGTITDVTSTSALVVRKDGDTGDVFAVDTTNRILTMRGRTSMYEDLTTSPNIGGGWFRIINGGGTYTDNSTAASGTASAHSTMGIGQMTLAATNSSVTTTNAASLYIAGAPVAGTNQTITNSYALWVDSGNVQLDGDLTVLGAINGGSVAYETIIVDSTSTEAFLVRKDGDTGDILTVDTTNNVVKITELYVEYNGGTQIYLAREGGGGGIAMYVDVNRHAWFANGSGAGHIYMQTNNFGSIYFRPGLTQTVTFNSGVTTFDADVLIDITDPEAFLVRKNGDTGDVFAINTSTNVVSVTGSITLSGTVDGRDLSVDGANLDTLFTTIGLSALTSAEVDQLENIGATTISATQWGYLGGTDQGVATSSNVQFNGVIADGTGAETLLVRKNADAGDVLAINTSTNVVSITGSITLSGTVDGRDLSVDGATLTNLATTIGLSALTSAEVDQLENIGATTISATQWGYLGGTDQGVATSSNVQFNGVIADGTGAETLLVRKNADAGDVLAVNTSTNVVSVTGNITVTGTVDGRDIAADGATLTNLATTIGLSALTSAEVDQLENIGATTISATQWGYLGGTDQGVATSSNVQFNGVIVDGTGVETLLVRKNGDTGDVFTVDTSSSIVTVNNTLNFVNSGAPLIYMQSSGAAAPTFTTRSSGTKLVLYESLSGSSVDYAIGVASSTVWFSIPEALNTRQFRWYGGMTVLSELEGDGHLSVFGTVNATSSTAGGSLTISGGAAVAKDLYVGGNITVSGTVDGRDIGADGATLTNLATTIGLSALTSAEVDQLENIGATTISATQWGYLGAMDQNVTTTDSVTFANETISQNLTVGTTLNTVYTAVVANTMTGNTGAQLYIVNDGNDGSGADRNARILVHAKSDGEAELLLQTTRDATDKIVTFQSVLGHFRIIDASNQIRLSLMTSGSLTLGGNTSTTKNVLIDGTCELDNLVTFTDGTASSSVTSASVVMSGGLSIAETTTATSITSGGALTVAGGTSIAGDVYIGGNLVVDGNSSTINVKQAVGSHTGTGVKTVTVNLGETLADTTYEVVVTAMSTTDNTNVYATTVVAKTTTTFKVNIYRLDVLGAGWTDTALEVGCLITP